MYKNNKNANEALEKAKKLVKCAEELVDCLESEAWEEDDMQYQERRMMDGGQDYVMNRRSMSRYGYRR